MQKNELRKKYKALRKQFSTTEIEGMSMQIANQLLSLDIWNYSYYHIFLPIFAQKEVDTEFVLHVLQGKDKHIVVSKSNFEDGTLRHFLLTDQTKISINKWGIPEPDEKSIPIPEQSIEVVFVPLLAYDKKGNRVGYGKGFYDRFLQNAKPKVIIGFSFFEPEITVIESDPYDIPLNFCVHPNGVEVFTGQHYLR